ncbi:MAG TPA: DNA polymerase I [Xanthomonadaceae bacterium]|nr:DNA polymerase I [Xanthomonadaceae bacterium]
MPRLVLIDGSSYLYRAFHALPPLTNAAGEPTGALFGVVNMLRATLAERPEYAAFVIDAPGPTFRERIDPDYKATRPPMPEELRAQVEPLMRIVQALGMPILRVPGVEADDVIGTLAVAAAQQDIEVTVSTSDKDFAQLVRPGITLVNTMSGTTLDREAVIAKFGVPPERVIDLLALMGDTVDNVRGVDKCGPKTAAKWLDQFGSLDAVMQRAGEVGGKLGENLRAVLARLPVNRELVTIRTDVPLEQGPAELALGARDLEQLHELYRRYEFRQALRELDAATQAPPPVPPDVPEAEGDAPAAPARGDYEVILEQARLQAWVERLRTASLVAFDTETDSLDPMRARLVGVSFAVEPGKAAYVPVAHEYPGAPAQLDRDAVLAALRPILEDPAIPKVGQHGKYDLHVLARCGVQVRGYAYDTLLESFVWNAGLARHDMDTLAERYLDHRTIRYEEVAGKGAKQIPFPSVEIERAGEYAAEDADITLRLHHALWPRLQSEPRLAAVFTDIEMPLVPVLQRIEANGVLIDAAELGRQSQDLARRMHAAQQHAYAVARRSFNLDSPKQLQALLFDELGLPVIAKTPTGQPSTNEDVLEQLAHEHELPRLIVEYRGLAKLRSTYTDKLPGAIHPDTGRVHTSYHQAGAATGRLSSSDPNLQNIPIRTEDGRRIRRAFVAPPGRCIVAADYSQIELRIMAHLSGDPGLMSAFAGGQDVHRATASEVFEVPLEQVGPDQRRAAKAINFGLMYGMSAFGLARQLGIDRGQAARYIERYFARYPGVLSFMEGTRQLARERGWVETVFGRRLHLAQINARNAAVRAGAERAAINAPMQGTAADIIKRAMVSVDRWLAETGARAAMIMQVHDELVFEADQDFAQTLVERVRELMQGAAELRVPLIVDTGVGANWDEAH